MAVTPERALALSVAVMTLLGAPTAAQAAMGGGNALTTALRPDLRSATVQSTNAVDDTTTVRFCFSKAIASLPQAALFRLGTYEADDPGDALVAVSATRSTSTCADAVFPNSDATQFTYGSALGSDGTAPDSGASAVSTNGFGNIGDSTALIGSKTNNGTRGFTVFADLVGIAVNNAAATIDYTFDQQVNIVNPGPSFFSYNTADGTQVDSLAGVPGNDHRRISSDGLTVRVDFPPGPQIQGAVRAFAHFAAVFSKASPNFGSVLRSAARPGNGGFTDRPDLVAVTLAADGSSVDYQFDQVITALGTDGDFVLTFSNGVSFNPGPAPTVVGGLGVGNTVRVPITFLVGGGTLVNELLVAGSTLAGAVTGAGGTSTVAGLPTGGNAGAFASGFTHGPEALSVSFDNATSVAHVRFDQRWLTAQPAGFKLLDDQGSQISAAAINISGSGSPSPCQCIADITFPPGTVAGARSLLIERDALGTFVGTENQTQVISPTAPASRTPKRFHKAKALRRTIKRR